MQFTGLKFSAFLCLAEGSSIDSLWFEVGAGDVRTDVCILDTSSWNDRSSKGSLLSWGSGLVPCVPLGFCCYPDGCSGCWQGAGSEGRL